MWRWRYQQTISCGNGAFYKFSSSFSNHSPLSVSFPHHPMTILPLLRCLRHRRNRRCVSSPPDDVAYVCCRRFRFDENLTLPARKKKRKFFSCFEFGWHTLYVRQFTTDDVILRQMSVHWLLADCFDFDGNEFGFNELVYRIDLWVDSFKSGPTPV